MSIITKAGNGTTPLSCMDCDPTYPVCAFGCQAKVGLLYDTCDSICLPDGFFFDPSTAHYMYIQHYLFICVQTVKYSDVGLL